MRNLPAVLPGHPFDVSRLRDPDDAVASYLAAAALAPPVREDVSLEEAWDRILATPVAASEAYPSHARSTMDGYAVRASDASSRRIVRAIRMGDASTVALGPGEAMTIPTGGALPHGADAVVPVEDATAHGDVLTTTGRLAAGDCVTRPGDDLQAGDEVLRPGRRIGGPELGVLATLGITSVAVFRRPRFAVISTGDELVPPEAPLRVGVVRDSNRYAVAGALRAMGALAVMHPRVRDDADALRAALISALTACDGVVITGGSSVGERDLVPRIVATLGDPGILVHGLRVKPGKPTMLAAVAGKPVIGLPGNPTSSLTILEAVARPIVRACTGEVDRGTGGLGATAADAFVGREGWTWFVPASLQVTAQGLKARPLILRSASTSLLARAAGYVIVGPSSARVEEGEAVVVRLFSSGGAPVDGDA